MSFSHAMKAVRDAQDCVRVGQFDTARALINEASDLVRAPSGQAAHLQSFMDAYEQTSATAHLGEVAA